MVRVGATAPEQSASATASGRAGITDSEVREQVARIVESDDFRVPPRSKKFLHYVVEEVLAGRGDRLKAYSIGIEVFGRDPSFDAQHDPVVRTEAARLRSALERFYLLDGANDPLVISIPKGGYVPHFERAANSDASERLADASASRVQAPFSWRQNWAAVIGAVIILAGAATWIVTGTWKASREISERPAGDSGVSTTGGAAAEAPISRLPVIRVRPFEGLGDTPSNKEYATGMAAEIAQKLVKFPDLRVVFDIGTADSLAAPDLRGARQFYVTGSIQVAGSKIRVLARLTDEAGVILWSGAYDKDLNVQNLISAQDDIADNVAISIGQPSKLAYGNTVVGSAEMPEDINAYACTMSYYTYRQAIDPAHLTRLQACLEKTLERFPDYATAWALLALVYRDRDLFYKGDPEGRTRLLPLALEAAQKAVALAPENVRALQALMLTSFLNQRVAAGKATGERALQLNPNDMELVGEYGTRLALAGEFERGEEMVRRAIAYNPANANFYRIQLAVTAYFRHDLKTAEEIIDAVDPSNSGITLICAAAIYADVGRAEDAKRMRDAFLKLGTRHMIEIDHEFDKRNLRTEDRVTLLKGFLKAGLPVPEAVLKKYGVDPAGIARTGQA